MKHAFLILAHNEFEVLRRLVAALDDPRNDIYIHFDRKVDTLPALETQHATLTVLEERIDVRWGGLSMLQAEVALFRAACSRGPYQYYHLLSGVDLPLRSQDSIHAFFDRNDGKEFIGYTLTQMTPEYVRKMQRRHLFYEHFKSRNMVIRLVRGAFIRAQEWLGIYRNKNIDFKKGSQWVSITDGMAHYFLAHEEWMMKVFRGTFCCDEVAMQTLCWMSPYREHLYNTTDDGTGCLRAIGWQVHDGWSQLIDYNAGDYEKLAASTALFARKFNGSDPTFLDRIENLAKR